MKNANVKYEGAKVGTLCAVAIVSHISPSLTVYQVSHAGSPRRESSASSIRHVSNV